MSVRHADYIEGLTYRIVARLKERRIIRGPATDEAAGYIKAEVAAVLMEIQDRIFQHVIADAVDVAHDLSPTTSRLPRTQ